jgi:DNA-directed RNA polymerase specialized sigma24 family protein
VELPKDGNKARVLSIPTIRDLAVQAESVQAESSFLYMKLICYWEQKPAEGRTPAMSASHEIAALLAQWASADQQALDDLTRRLYKELRQLAGTYPRKERPDHTLQSTAAVSEVYVRLLSQKQGPILENRSQFFARKRGGRKVPLDDAIDLPDGRKADPFALDSALKALTHVDARKCKVVELRYFGGLSDNEIADTLNLSTKPCAAI